MGFVYINHHFLDNLFYILVSVFVYFILIDHSKRMKQYKKTLLIACMSVPIILCMRFPIYIDEYCVHDFRQIPLFIGTLYGGWPVGAVLLVITLLGRFYLFGFNFLTLIVYLVIFFSTALFANKFNGFKRKGKVLSSSLLSFVVGVMTTLIAVSFSDFFQVTEAYVFYFVIMPPIIMFSFVYLAETLQDAINIKPKMVKLEKMEVVSQLAASISHEVRNPLTVVKGFIDLLKDPNLSQDKRDEYIEHINRELQSAESIISDYLAFAKPATEQINPIFVDREISSILQMIKPWANMNSVHISEELTPGVIHGNTQHFKQCFINLIKNGIEAMPEGGELRVITSVSNKHITIKIEDSGVGMTKEQLNRFGEPYYSSKEKGTGLGSMVIVRTIQTMNGTLDISSVLHKGTTITVKLPEMESDAR
ncbi:ATP-binding protein [Mesobacillus maritimus]|uniref:ATP-binding protein n=1 Tax=Mesobacillus maritimus TaxID=1643336 RepID=UPI00384F9C46